MTAARRQSAHPQHEQEDRDVAGVLLTDPVCGMSVRPDAPHHAAHAGVEYAFCSARCRERFVEAPESFLREVPGAVVEERRAQSPEKTRGGATWTCPMHPEIVRDAPGSCPICGMALERVVASAEEEENPELKDMSRRFWIAAAFTLPLVLMAMSELIDVHLMSGRSQALVGLALATPVCTWAAWPFYVRGVASLRNRRLNMFTLIGLGVFVAYLYSLVAALLPGIFPASFRGPGGEVGVYFESRCRHRHTDFARASARAPRTQPDRRRAQGTPWARADDGAQAQRGWQ